jgi:hypothetical protein
MSGVECKPCIATVYETAAFRLHKPEINLSPQRLGQIGTITVLYS